MRDCSSGEVADQREAGEQAGDVDDEGAVGKAVPTHLAQAKTLFPIAPYDITG
jgi:hypothetical protein